MHDVDDVDGKDCMWDKKTKRVLNEGKERKCHEDRFTGYRFDV
jgi:hypothetical protein